MHGESRPSSLDGVWLSGKKEVCVCVCSGVCTYAWCRRKGDLAHGLGSGTEVAETVRGVLFGAVHVEFVPLPVRDDTSGRNEMMCVCVPSGPVRREP